MITYQKHIPALDGLRGIAILAVFFHHYAGGLHNGGLLSALLGFGWSGVDLFFVLSGFLITGILCDTRSGEGYYRNFYVRRSLRIFPVYYLTALVLLTLGVAHWTKGHLLFLVYLGYPAAVIWPSLATTGITHTWSLCLEEQFYAMWPYVIRHLSTLRRALIGCAAVALGALALRAILLAAQASEAWVYGFVLCRMDTLATGAAIAVGYRTVGAALMSRIARWVGPVAVTALVTICLFRGATDHNGWLMETAGYSFNALAYGALLILAINSEFWSRLFSVRPLRQVGRYSYAMYLYHFPLMMFLLGPFHARMVSLLHSELVGGVAYVALALAFNLSLAAISFHCFESPILKLKSKFEYGTTTHRPLESYATVLSTTK